MVGAPEQNSAAIDRLRGALSEGRLPHELSAELRRLAQSYELSTSEQASPQLIALWADTCPRFTQWDQLSRSADPFMQAYSWVFRGCESAVFRAKAGLSIATPILVLTGRRDTIVPAGLQTRWVDAARSARRLSGSSGHFWDGAPITRGAERWMLTRLRTGDGSDR